MPYLMEGLRDDWFYQLCVPRKIKSLLLLLYLTLTLWDKISQNLADKHKAHFVVFITSFLHLNKSFWLFGGRFNVIFVKIWQNLIKSPLKYSLSHRFQLTVYVWACHDAPINVFPQRGVAGLPRELDNFEKSRLFLMQKYSTVKFLSRLL